MTSSYRFNGLTQADVPDCLWWRRGESHPGLRHIQITVGPFRPSDDVNMRQVRIGVKRIFEILSIRPMR